MRKLYRNAIDLNWIPDPIERRQNISKEIVRHSDYLPKTLNYEDIDRCFKDWVDSSISIIQDGIKLPTMVLYSNQRFSEYMQTWQYTDENNNVRLNFKTVTRENNPSHGTIHGDIFNIPGDRFYTLKSIQAIDESGKKYRIDYKMKQPTPVDIIYKVSIMTNRYTSINEFNERIQQLFNAKQSYLCVNGHYMSMTLENISDESEYNIEDRQFFSQTFNVKLKGYIIKENDLKVEENPISTIICFEGDSVKRRKPSIDLSEYDACFNKDENNYTKEIEIDVDFSFCYPHNGKTKFTIDENFIIKSLKLKDKSNLINNQIKLFINDEFITDDLLRDSYEGYKKMETKPMDSNETNTIQLKEIPNKKNKDFKYILCNNFYYIWHKIEFFDGDEICIETKKENKHKESTGLILNGYNRFEIVPN